jgi:cholesterol transport system auxiliary component
MNTRRLLIAASATLVLAACAVGKPIPQATTFGIEPPPPTLALARRPETLRMGRVRVAPAFAGKSMVLRVDAVRYEADYYNAFLAEPADLLGTAMADWLDRAGPFRSVTQPGTKTPAAYALEATVTQLYGDFRPGLTPTAVMTVQFTLVDLRGVALKVALERTIGRRIALRDATPEELARGYGVALGQILEELAPELKAANP